MASFINAEHLQRLFDGLDSSTLRPSLLHGDFWTGNVGMVEGQPAIFDPAAYYGHHEVHWCGEKPVEGFYLLMI